MNETVWNCRIGGLEISIRVHGRLPETRGFYSEYPSHGRTPSLQIDITIDPDFRSQECAANAPSFTVTSRCDGLELSHRECKGRLRFEPDGEVIANFVASPKLGSLEAALRATLSIALPLHGALLLHSSAVVDQRGAHVFSGVSGAGKSTIATMLDETFDVLKISDELSILHKHEGQWRLGVSPFIGSDGLPHGDERVLASINFLEQYDSHQRTEITAVQAMGQLCQHALTYAQIPTNVSQCVLDLAADLVGSVPCYHLRFTRDPSVAEVLGITC